MEDIEYFGESFVCLPHKLNATFQQQQRQRQRQQQKQQQQQKQKQQKQQQQQQQACRRFKISLSSTITNPPYAKFSAILDYHGSPSWE